MVSRRGKALTILLTLILVAPALLLMPLGCGKKAEGEIKIGVITPLTGEGATYGDATRKGVDLAIEEINRHGGIDGRNVTVSYEDSQIDPKVGASALQRLISIEKVPVVLGAFGSSVSLAIAPKAEKDKVVLFSASSTADALRDAGDYFFRNVPSNSVQGRSAADFARKSLGAQTAAILLMNNDYGLSLTAAFEQRFVELGGSIVLKDSYNPGDNDFRTQLTKIARAEPDVVFFPGHYAQSGPILRQSREMGIEIPFIGGDGSYSPELIAIAGEAAEGTYYTLMAMGFGEADAEIVAFKSAFNERYGEEPDVYAAYAYDAIKIIADAIRRGGYTSDGIKEALYSTKNFLGVTGLTTFDSNGEVNKDFYIYEVVNGQFVLRNE